MQQFHSRTNASIVGLYAGIRRWVSWHALSSIPIHEMRRTDSFYLSYVATSIWVLRLCL